MTTQRLGLIMNGVTGRMGLNQHLIRSIVAIREQGGVRLKNGDRVITNGGIHGTVVGVSDHVIQVRIADQVKIDISRNAVAALQLPDSES